MDSPESQIYRFEDVEIDALRGRLRCGGEERHLRQKAFSVLVYLLEQRGRVITKDELMDEVWKDTAVTDDALVQCIRDIRRALGDDSHRPRFIRTIPKIGYCFISPVVENFNGSVTTHIEEITRVELQIEEETERDVETKRLRDGEILSSTHKFISVSRRLSVPSSQRLLLITILAAVSAIAPLVYLAPNLFKSQSEEIRLSPAPGKKAVAVMFFENQSGDADLDWLREGLADMLIANLSRSDKLAVLSRGQLRVLLERTKRDPAVKIPLDEALEIARRTGAETVITGSFARLGEKMRLEVQLYEIQTGRLQSAESLTVDRPEQVLSEIDLLSFKLANRLGATENQEEKRAGLGEIMTNNLEAYRYYSLGVEQAQAYHNKEAIELFEKAITLDPQFAMAHARIGYAYAVNWDAAEKGKPYLERAFQISERLTEKDKLNIAAWYAIANLDYQNAIRQFRQIISKYPTETEAHLRLARLLGEEQTEEAIVVLKQGLTVDPEAKELYNLLGSIFSRLGRHDEAIAALERYLALAPDEPNAFDSLGMSYQWAGNYDAAIKNYNRALELNPNFDIAIVHLANTRFQNGQYREAMELYRRYIKNAPSDSERARGFYSIAVIHLRKRELDRAEKAANEALKFREDVVWYPFVIAQMRGDEVRAKKLEERIFAKTRFTNRGNKLTQRAEFYYRGYIALKNGRGEEAVANFQEAIRQLPPYWDVDALEDCLANAYLKLGRFDEAIGEYERILRLNPNYPLARFHLAQSYERKGQVTEARENYRQFLETWKNSDDDIPEVISARNSLGD